MLELSAAFDTTQALIQRPAFSVVKRDTLQGTVTFSRILIALNRHTR